MEKFSYRRLLNVVPWIITVVAVTLLVFRSDTSAQRPTVVNAGRYQIVTGRFYGTVDGKATDEASGVFKIDTETGATWIYLIHKDARSSLQGWAPITTLVRQQ